MQALRKAFRYLDKDKNGTLDPEEFKGLMTSKGEVMEAAVRAPCPASLSRTTLGKGRIAVAPALACYGPVTSADAIVHHSRLPWCIRRSTR